MSAAATASGSRLDEARPRRCRLTRSSTCGRFDSTSGRPVAIASHTELGEPSERGTDTPTVAARMYSAMSACRTRPSTRTSQGPQFVQPGPCRVGERDVTVDEHQGGVGHPPADDSKRVEHHVQVVDLGAAAEAEDHRRPAVPARTVG